MKHNTLHKQCTIESVNGSRSTSTKWLPINLAKVGGLVEFKDSEGNWSGDVWSVLSVGNTERDCKELLEKMHKQWGSLDMPRRRGK
jgi:hypothetical protein